MDPDNHNEKPDDRRRAPRASVHQPATVESPDFGAFEVLIQNYSSTGIYVVLLEGGAIVDHAVASQLTPDCEVFLRIKLPDNSTTVAAARIDRVGDLGLGIAYFQPQEKLNRALADVAAEQGFSDSSNRELDDSTRNKARAAVRKTVLDTLEGLMSEFMLKAQDDLMDASSQTPANRGQTAFFEAMSLLRRQGDSVKADFIDRLRRHLENFNREDLFPELKASSGQSELSLVNEQEFEDWLALSDIIHSLEMRNHQALHALEARMTVLLGERADARNNPAAPAAVCHHLYEALKDLPLEHGTRLVLWKCFARVVAPRIDPIYQKLNEALIEAGILPKLAFRYATPIQRRSADSGTSPAAGEGAHAPPEASHEVAGASRGNVTQFPQGRAATGQPAPPGTPSASTIIDLRDVLMQRKLDVASARRGGGPGGHPFGMDELNQALIDLQQRERGDGHPLSERVENALKQRFGQDAKRAVAEDHANAIYLAQRLLDAIGSDDVVESVSKRWIQELEIPLLRLLLQDDSLLRDPDHPARKVIDQLGRAHVSGDTAGDDRQAGLTEQIENVVRELRQKQSPGREDFATAADALEGLLKRQQRLRASQMRRVLEAAEGQHRMQKARRTVQRELDRRFAGSSVPRVILQLLELGLRSLLDLAAVREGIEGDEWHETIGVVDDLRRLLDGSEPAEATDPAAVDALIQRLEQKLIQAGTEGPERDELLAGIREVLPSEDGPAEAPEMVTYEASAEAGSDDADEDPERSLWRGRAKMLETGSWLLLPSEDGKMKARRLAWVSDDYQRYVFVDRQGRKALELSLDELADRLKADEADVVDQNDKPLMDRTWQGMIEQMHEQIAHQATHDQLTNTLNRKEFERQLRLKLGESKLMHSQHVVLQIDLDQFKVINSTAGHDAGDQLLRDYAGMLQDALPKEATVARVGGDEFAVLLPRHEPAPGHEVAEKLRKATASHHTKWKRRKLKTTASIGLVSVNCDTESVSQVLNQLESACVAAKEAGNDRVKSYQLDDHEMTQRDRAMQWVSVVERAVDNDQLILYAQRIQPLESDTDLEHYEVLVRMLDEQGAIITPDEFVPAAEAYGRIHYLDEWVFRKAFSSLARSPRADRIARLSVNVSGKTFSRPRFADTVQRLLEETGVSPSKICFEITETAAISNLSRCTDFLRQLRYLGCRFSLDDFGTGLASFSYLKHLPVDYLKIDGSFVREIVESPSDHGLVKTINEIGHFLGKQTVAEFVENEAIMTKLREIGVDFAQGFGIARPSPLDEILELD